MIFGQSVHTLQCHIYTVTNIPKGKKAEHAVHSSAAEQCWAKLSKSKQYWEKLGNAEEVWMMHAKKC